MQTHKHRWDRSWITHRKVMKISNPGSPMQENQTHAIILTPLWNHPHHLKSTHRNLMWLVSHTTWLQECIFFDTIVLLCVFTVCKSHCMHFLYSECTDYLVCHCITYCKSCTSCYQGNTLDFSSVTTTICMSALSCSSISKHMSNCNYNRLVMSALSGSSINVYNWYGWWFFSSTI